MPGSAFVKVGAAAKRRRRIGGTDINREFLVVVKGISRSIRELKVFPMSSVRLHATLMVGGASRSGKKAARASGHLPRARARPRPRPK